LQLFVYNYSIPTLETMKSMPAILLGTLVLALANIASGKLVINEIMLQPKTAVDAATQWFELYNTQNTVVQLKGYVFTYCQGLPYKCKELNVQHDISVGPYGYVVFGNNGNTATNGGVPLIELQFEMVKDGSGSNYLDVFPPTGAGYDDLLWWSTDSGATSLHAKLPFASGASVAKVNAIATGQDTTNWKTSTTSTNCDKGGDMGTPGKLNTYLCPTKPPTKAPTKTPTKAPTRTPTKKPTPAPTRTPTKKPTMGPTKAPQKGPTNAPAKSAPSIDAPNKAPVMSAPAAPVKSPTGSKPNAGHKRCGLLGLSIVCFNGCGMFGRLLNMCQL
jgi:Lamin Tail Domain